MFEGNPPVWNIPRTLPHDLPQSLLAMVNNESLLRKHTSRLDVLRATGAKSDATDRGSANGDCPGNGFTVASGPGSPMLLAIVRKYLSAMESLLASSSDSPLPSTR